MRCPRRALPRTLLRAFPRCSGHGRRVRGTRRLRRRGRTPWLSVAPCKAHPRCRRTAPHGPHRKEARGSPLLIGSRLKSTSRAYGSGKRRFTGTATRPTEAVRTKICTSFRKTLWTNKRLERRRVKVKAETNHGADRMAGRNRRVEEQGISLTPNLRKARDVRFPSFRDTSRNRLGTWFRRRNRVFARSACCRRRRPVVIFRVPRCLVLIRVLLRRVVLFRVLLGLRQSHKQSRNKIRCGIACLRNPSWRRRWRYRNRRKRRRSYSSTRSYSSWIRS
mmetsp:Transcript_5574/g.21088  ORF Transcript_5574/g.21088 Transcript_5574/m.21088 type:complete len:277 (+) Transcript_5574:245-1075(+)